MIGLIRSAYYSRKLGVLSWSYKLIVNNNIHCSTVQGRALKAQGAWYALRNIHSVQGTVQYPQLYAIVDRKFRGAPNGSLPLGTVSQDGMAANR